MSGAVVAVAPFGPVTDVTANELAYEMLVARFPLSFGVSTPGSE